MKNLLISFPVIIFLSSQHSFSQNITEINETISPIQNEEIIYNEEELEKNQNIRNFIQELENSNSEIIESISASNNNDVNYISEENSISENIDNIETKENNNNNNIEDIEINLVLKELGNETALEENEENFISDSINTSQSNILSQVSSQKLDKLSISSYGIVNNNSLFDQDIWKSIDINKAKELLKISKTKLYLNSYKNIIFDLLVSSYQYPIGLENDEKELFLLRMDLMSFLFQINDLKEFIANLPNEEDFDDLKSWIVKDAFLKLEDEYACELIEKISSRNVLEFWQLAQIFCLVINGNEDEALFMSELVRASGLEDENFYTLLENMIDKNSTKELNLDSLNLLHVIMMDQIKNTIPEEIISNTPSFMLSSLLNLKHLQADMKAVILDKLIKDQQVDINLIEENYLKIGDENNSLGELISKMEKTSGAQSRADLWLKIKNETSIIEKNSSIIKILYVEAQNGRAIQTLKLYFPKMKSKENSDIYDKFKILYEVIFNKNTNFEDELYQKNMNLIDILSFKKNSFYNINFMNELNVLDIIPLLDEFGMNPKENDYLSNILNINKEVVLNNVHPIIKTSLNNALKDNRIPEALLILPLIIEDKNLNEISVYEILQFVILLKEIGLEENANEVALEWIGNKLIKEISSTYINLKG